MLNSIVVAASLCACTVVVHVASSVSTRAELQWDADAVALASSHSDESTAHRLAALLGVRIVGAGSCGDDLCVEVASASGSAVARASRR